MKKIIAFTSLILSALIVLTSCGAVAGDAESAIGLLGGGTKGDVYYSQTLNCAPSEMEMPEVSEVSEEMDIVDGIADEYEGYFNKVIENPFISTAVENTSTFSADVDTASYAFFRRLVNEGYGLSELIATAGPSIRTEEMINYFDYGYENPADGEIFSTSVQIAPCPWNSETSLLVLGMKTVDTPIAARNNLVFLIDVSGSMRSADKLELLKEAFTYLVSFSTIYRYTRSFLTSSLASATRSSSVILRLARSSSYASGSLLTINI